jgi:hypothetical protein
MTQTDILKHNEDLLVHCEALLAAQPWTRMNVRAKGRALEVTTVGIDRLDVYRDTHPARPTMDVKRDGTRKIEIPSGGRVEVVGYAGTVVCQRRRLSVR